MYWHRKIKTTNGKNNLKPDDEMKQTTRGSCDYRFDVDKEIFAVTWKDNNVV